MKAKKVQKLLEPICVRGRDIVERLEAVYEPDVPVSKEVMRNHLVSYRIAMTEHLNEVFNLMDHLAQELQVKQEKKQQQKMMGDPIPSTVYGA